MFAGTGEDDHPSLGIVAKGERRGLDFGQVLVVERIGSVRPVEGDGCHRAVVRN